MREAAIVVLLMVLMTVAIPAGLQPGDSMSIEAAGQTFTVLVPDGCSAGMDLEVDLNVEEEAAASTSSATQQVELVVPAGIWPGDPFSVEHDGGVFEICCPEGCAAGDAILVDLPVAVEQQQEEVPAWRDAAPCSEGPLKSISEDDGYKYKPGDRVELLRTDGAYSPGTIVYGFEGVLDVLYKVQLDNGLCKEAVPEEDLGTPCDVGDLFDGF